MRARERGDDMTNLFILEYKAQFAIASAAIIADCGDVSCASSRQRLNKIIWETGSAEAAEHNASSVTDVGNGSIKIWNDFGLHTRDEIVLRVYDSCRA